MPFKKGAFYAEKTVLPVVLKYTYEGFSTDFALFDPLALLMMTLSWIWGGLKCELLILPEFQPNDFMYEKFADKGKERWEAFSWCLRDTMSKTSGLKTSDMPNRGKFAYWKHLNGKSGIDDFENKSVEQIIEEYTIVQDKNN